MTSVDIIACNIKIGSDDFERMAARIQNIIAGIIDVDGTANLDEEIPVLLIAPVCYSCKSPFMRVIVYTDQDDSKEDIRLKLEEELEETSVRLQIKVI